jgi:hypothetical protein
LTCRNLWGSFSEDKRTSFTYLDCLWFNLYRGQPHKAKVLTWIKKKHIFLKKYVLVPIICWLVLSINLTAKHYFSCKCMGFLFCCLVSLAYRLDWIFLKCHCFRGHWSLLIFCHFGESLQSKTRTPCMLLLDSLEMGNPRRVEPDIRKYASKQTLPPCFSIVVY